MAGYNKNRDYKAEIDAAVKAGNYVLAGSLERERNAKIAGEGLNYAQTNDYTSYVDRDYGEEILDGIRRGDYGAVSEANTLRGQKTALSGYTQYASDDISRKAQNFIDLGNTLNQEFSYDKGAAQVQTRQKEIDELYNSLKNYKKFEYDPETDPLYAALAAQYTRNGQRAMQDTLAQVSARTGGLASSYAATAGNQAYANYMAELGDRVPELAQLAYQIYNDDYNKQVQQAQLAQSMYESDLAKFQNDRNFAYGQFADNRNMAYNRLRDLTEGERYNTEWDYKVDQDKLALDTQREQWDYSTKLEKAQTLAAYGIFDGFKELDYTDEQIKELEDGYAAQMAARAKKSGSGGTSKPVLTFDQVNEAIENGNLTPGVLAAYEYYHKQPYKPEGPGDNDGSIEGLGLGEVSDTLLQMLAGAGALATDGNGGIYWANGWNKDNYLEALKLDPIWLQPGVNPMDFLFDVDTESEPRKIYLTD